MGRFSKSVKNQMGVGRKDKHCTKKIFKKLKKTMSYVDGLLARKKLKTEKFWYLQAAGPFTRDKKPVN